MTLPKITRQEAEERIKKTGILIPERVLILGIRGYYKDTMGEPGVNDRAIYDDALVLVGPDTFLAVNANTDPSKYAPGIATLVPGLHYYKKGSHHIGKPNAYPAFRPASPDESVPVTRDGETRISKGIAINIHRGGVYSTSSLGCQTVYPDQWLHFQQTAYKAMADADQKLIPYLLIVE